MFSIIDTFNNRVIGKYETLEAAVKADIKFARSFARANSKNSYMPTKIVDADGNNIADKPELVEQASRAAYSATDGR